MPIERFTSDFWERDYLLVPADRSSDSGAPGRRLFSFDHADQVLSVRGPRFRDFIRMSKGGHAIPREEYSAVRHDGLVDFNLEKVFELYDDGATITLNRAHQCSAELAAFCADLSRDVGAHVNANVYITPSNSQGFAAHSDTHDVFLLQTEGSKHWRVQRRLDYLATPRNTNSASDPVATAWDDFTLHVGDTLYLPRGLLHEGIAGGSHSLHITLGIHPYTWGELVRDAIAELESQDDLLRRSVTALSTDTGQAARVVASRLTARLLDADAVASLVRNRTGVYRRGSDRGRFRRLTDPAPITLTTAVRLRPGLDVALQRCGDEVVLTFGSKSLTFPGYVHDHLRALLGSRPVTAEDLPIDIDDAGKLTLLRRLHAEGVLRVVPGSGG